MIYATLYLEKDTLWGSDSFQPYVVWHQPVDPRILSHPGLPLSLCVSSHYLDGLSFWIHHGSFLGLQDASKSLPETIVVRTSRWRCALELSTNYILWWLSTEVILCVVSLKLAVTGPIDIKAICSLQRSPWKYLCLVTQRTRNEGERQSVVCWVEISQSNG